MRFRKTTFTAVSLTALLALSPACVPAQTTNQSSVPTIKVYTRETLVDVTVTDANGQPVHGLTRSDFSITEDDKPQSIRSFQEFSNNTPVTASTPRKLPPNTYSNLQHATGPLIVLLLDDVNGEDGAKVRAEATKFIQSMTPGMQVALLAIGFRLTVLQGPTTDPSLLLKVVNAQVKPLLVPPEYCMAQTAKNWATLEQLDQVAAYLSGIKGKKNLLWINSGVPKIIYPDQTQEGGTPLCLQNFAPPLSKTYAKLADAQVTVYPLDPKGLVVPPATTTPALLLRWYQDQSKQHLSMEAVAEATGGVAFYNSNDLSGFMVKASDIGSNYYTLSYAPPSVKYDGRYHAISIKVGRPGVHLVYRKGYSAEDPTLIEHPPEIFLGHVTRDTRPTGPPADPLAAALSPIAPPATQLQFDVRVEPSTEPANPFDPPVMGQLNPKLKRVPLTRYGFLFTLPQSQIAFADAGGGTYSGSVEFDVAAFDTDGKLVTILSQTQKLPLTNEEYREFIATPFQFFQQVDLPPGQFTLHAGVLDGVSNKVGTVEIPLTVGKKPPAPVVTDGGTESK